MSVKRFKSEDIKRNCTHMSASFKRVLSEMCADKESLTPGEALVFWMFDLLAATNIFIDKLKCEEGMLLLADELFRVISTYGNKLEDAIKNNDEELPISELIICDRQRVGLIGYNGFIDVIEAKKISDNKIGSFLERINYSLATLYVRQNIKFITEKEEK